jgi:exonuclease SbcC
MLITRVELQNIKSYCDEVVTFVAGTNAIFGENGAGKSTLLEAIGFALFDYLPYTHADFVREGEKTATVAVSFVSDQDGREYQVVRRCGGSSDYYVYDPELKARIVATKADVLDWLKEHLGVEVTTDLTALFRDAVGVPQGLLTAPFLQRPSERKPLFDRLLRVDEYEQAWKTLRETSHHLEARLGGHRETIAGLGSRVQRLPGLRDRAETLAAEVARIESRLADLRGELDEASARREALEASQKELDSLLREVDMLRTRLQEIGKQLTAAERSVAEAEAAQAMVESSQAGYEAYRSARAMLSSLEAERTQRDSLQAERTAQEKSLALAQERAKGLDAELLQAKEAEAHMQALQPEVERFMACEADLQNAREQVRSLEIAEAQLAERHARLDELQRRLEAIESGLAEARHMEADLRDARSHLEGTRRSLATLQAEQATLTAEAKRLAEQIQGLELTDLALCPLCEQPLTPEHRADLLARNAAQRDELKVREQALVEEAKATQGRNSALEEEIHSFEAKLRRLPRPADRDDLLAQVAGLEAELAATQSAVEGLAGSPEEVARLQQDLSGMGDPRRQYERLAEKAGRRAELEDRLEAERQALAMLQGSLAELEHALAPFAGLDGRLAEGRAVLNRNEEDHRRYLENARIADDLPARRQQLAALRAQQAELSTERDARQREAAELGLRFDPGELAVARQGEAKLQVEQAGLQGQLDGLRRQVKEAAQEIEELEVAERMLAAEKAAQDRDQQLLALTEFIREVIRRAGPQVTRRLMQQVSLEAARLFAEVMADYTGRLRWDENYEIVLEKDGRDRVFQQLSGGEQMAAALAVRLALLRELSAIDVAFFDEPTSNLDDARRDSLAEQILSVKGFSQIFVISHDDTFERVTHHIVRVRKEDGVSKVEAQ